MTVLEQNYEYDLLSATKLLEKYVGRTVRIRYRSPYTDREDEKEAKVLAYNDGQPVLMIDNEVTFGIPGIYIFPEVPRDLIARPTLSWLLGAKEPGRRELEALYLTNGMTWRADYVLVLGADEDRADLSGWVTLDNRSGATFRSVRLKLVAGDVNRVREDLGRRGYPAAKAAMALEAAPQFKESELFEYHLYALSRPTDVKNNQSKQVGLLAAEAVPVKKEYVFSGADRLLPRPAYRGDRPEPEGARLPPFPERQGVAPRDAAPEGDRTGVQARPGGRPPVRRGEFDRPHAEGREGAVDAGGRLRRGRRPEADGLEGRLGEHVRGGVRDLPAEPQEGRGDGPRGGADPRGVEDPRRDPPAREGGFRHRRFPGEGGPGQGGHATLPGADPLLTAAARMRVRR